jgi:sulfur-oxidizing protein SoxZ
MAIPMKIRALSKGDSGEIKVLISHPSENGMRKDNSGKLVPTHFIKFATVTVNGKTVLDGLWGPGVSKDPYLGFKVKGMKAGDKVIVNVISNTGEKDSVEATAS